MRSRTIVTCSRFANGATLGTSTTGKSSSTVDSGSCTETRKFIELTEARISGCFLLHMLTIAFEVFGHGLSVWSLGRFQLLLISSSVSRRVEPLFHCPIRLMRRLQSRFEGEFSCLSVEEILLPGSFLVSLVANGKPTEQGRQSRTQFPLHIHRSESGGTRVTRAHALAMCSGALIIPHPLTRCSVLYSESLSEEDTNEACSAISPPKLTQETAKSVPNAVIKTQTVRETV